jgi:hypothetical protein
MTTNNSLLEFYSGLMQRMYSDIADHLCLNSAVRVCELEVIRVRALNEGFSFLTKALPRLGKAVDTALATNAKLIVPEGWETDQGTGLPLFMGWLLEYVFIDDGTERVGDLQLPVVQSTVVKQPTATQAIAYFRQFVYTLYKLRIPYDETQTETVIRSFVETDAELAALDLNDLDRCSTQVLDYARWFTTTVFGRLDEMDIVPSHGPGSVATGEDGPHKTRFKRIYKDIDVKYPFTEYFMWSLSHVSDDLDRLEDLEILESGTAKVVPVPKDSRGPRLISCEPLEKQWIQQGLGRRIVSHLESFKLTKGHVNFTDQTVNRRLAQAGSLYSYARSGAEIVPVEVLQSLPALRGFDVDDWVTLDMKDASDRVSLALVKELFKDCPGLLDGLLAARSGHTQLPSGTVMALNKFAPMGSALCFPVEAFVFFALMVGTTVDEMVTAEMQRTYSTREVVHGRRNVLKRMYFRATRKLYVYGDDIVCLRQVYPQMLHNLEKFGLRFNLTKCCTAGSFRESCGCDAYRGVDVTPTRLSVVWSSERSYEPDILLGYTAFSNVMYHKGYVGVANFIRSRVCCLYGPIPYTDYFSDSTVAFGHSWDRSFRSQCGTSSGCVFYANHAPLKELNQYVATRWHSGHQVYRYRSYSVRARKCKAPYDGYRELLRRFNDGLGRLKGKYAIRHRSRLVRTWVKA